MESFSGEDSSQDEVAGLKSARANVAAVVVPQGLLVPGRADGDLAARFLKEERVFFLQVSLVRLVEGEDPRGAMLELGGENCFRPVDQEEGRLGGWLGCCCVN